jgi:hypothetical protein
MIGHRYLRQRRRIAVCDLIDCASRAAIQATRKTIGTRDHGRMMERVVSTSTPIAIDLTTDTAE